MSAESVRCCRVSCRISCAPVAPVLPGGDSTSSPAGNGSRRVEMKRCGARGALLRPLPARTAESVDGFQHRRDQRALGIRELGAPDVEEEDDSQLCAPVPGLMLHRVVENDELAFAPGPSLVADSESTLRRHDQRQVTNETRVEKPMMGGYVRTRAKQGEKRGRRAALDAAERQPPQGSQGRGTERRILRDLLAV